MCGTNERIIRGLQGLHSRSNRLFSLSAALPPANPVRVSGVIASYFETKKPDCFAVRLLFNLAATYSRGGYTTTTIGKAAFDGRVRNGIGSVHSFMTTKNLRFKVSGSMFKVYGL